MYSKTELESAKEIMRRKKRDLAKKAENISDNDLLDLVTLNVLEEAVEVEQDD